MSWTHCRYCGLKLPPAQQELGFHDPEEQKLYEEEKAYDIQHSKDQFEREERRPHE